MSIIDKRTSGKNKSVGNRQRFIKRYKNKIRRQVDDISTSRGITDAMKDRKIVIDDVDEPAFQIDRKRGDQSIIHSGNETFKKGDKIPKPQEGKGRGTGGSDSGDGFDEFTFTLSKDEFLDLYFHDMELPDFIKESLTGTTKLKWKRHGYSKDGIPSRLDLKKTLKQSLARRIATKSKRFLDNVDMRYKHFTKQPFPIRKAVMFCLMDVSASMGKREKELAKKFFLLLYLFLHTAYEAVEIRFVRHTHEAAEVSEKEFFYGTETGGTVVSAGLQLVNEIIDSQIDLEATNVYVSQASDGDNFGYDNDRTISLLNELLNKVQQFTYIQVDSGYAPRDSIYELYSTVEARNLSIARVEEDKEIYPTLRKLFEKESS